MPPLNSFSACKPCRRLKRKCSGEIPACSLCVRLRRVCEYVEEAPGAKVVQSSTSGRHRRAKGGGKSVASKSNFPSAFFLEPDAFQRLPQDAFKLTCPSFAAEACAKIVNDYDRIFSHFARTAHSWLPILSLKRIRGEIVTPSAKKNGNLALLFMCMDLVSNTCQMADNYEIAKRWAFEAEATGFISASLTQSLVFLAMYELGHAIYPAAYLTIGRAARLGGLMGLHSFRYKAQLFMQPDTWTLCEEQRRLWWAILTLDRMVVAGSNSLLLATDEPGNDDLLPCNDADWTQGIISTNEALLTTSFHSNGSLGSFAMACQAVHMLGKVLSHNATKQTIIETGNLVEEALSLHRALSALDSSITFKKLDQDEIDVHSTHRFAIDLEPGTAICSIARLILYNQYACNEPSQPPGRMRVAEEVEAQAVSLDGIQFVVSKRIATLARCIAQDEDGATEVDKHSISHSPLLAACLYHAATECAWFVKEDQHGEAMLEALRNIIAALKVLADTWGAAGKYLDLLRADDTISLIGD